jgi:hypothetical protein
MPAYNSYPTPDVIPVTLVTDTAAYAAADVLVIPQAIPNFFRTPGGLTVLRSVTLQDEAIQSQSLDLVFSSVVTTLGTINGAVTATDATLNNVLAHLQIITTDYVSYVQSSIAVKTGLYLPMQGADGVSSVYIGAMCRSGTPTYAASSLKLKLGIDRY